MTLEVIPLEMSVVTALSNSSSHRWCNITVLSLSLLLHNLRGCVHQGCLILMCNMQQTSSSCITWKHMHAIFPYLCFNRPTTAANRQVLHRPYMNAQLVADYQCQSYPMGCLDSSYPGLTNTAPVEVQTASLPRKQQQMEKRFLLWAPEQDYSICNRVESTNK
jgi:hypothetical protein